MTGNVLIVGSGGREHALAWKLVQSPHLNKLYIAPGNGGTCGIAENISIKATDITSLVQFAEKHAINLTVVGPDDPLALGIVDAFQAQGLRIFGPTRMAAEIESSKAFAKQLMRDVGISTAPFRIFQKYGEALSYIREHGAPVVVKASGLALGKGAYPCRTLEQAETALTEIKLDRVHKDAGDEVIVEEFLEGQEISIHALSDGDNCVLLPPAQDHKQIFDGDKGKNTGGMGTIAPVPWFNVEMLRDVKQRVVQPTLDTLNQHGRKFIGCLYPGLKMTDDGLQVLEFNARFGDPETQVYMRLLKTDLLDILDACVDGRLVDIKVEWRRGFAVCIVLASDGYPCEYRKNVPIYGINEASQMSDVIIFHAGTVWKNRLRTSGGRVLGVTTVGETLQVALDKAYEAVERIHFNGMQYRKDIGVKALA